MFREWKYYTSQKKLDRWKKFEKKLEFALRDPISLEAMYFAFKRHRKLEVSF